jgi:hypothetical protein
MNQSVDEVKTQLGNLATNLFDTLEVGDHTKTLIAQQELTGTVTTLWNAREEVDVDPKTKAILRLVAGWVMNDLPTQIQDPTNHAEIKRELKLFQRSLMMFN